MPASHSVIDLRSPSPDSARGSAADSDRVPATSSSRASSYASPVRRVRRTPPTAPSPSRRAGPSRLRVEAEPEVIELSDSDDDVEITGGAGPSRRTAPLPRRTAAPAAAQPRLTGNDQFQSVMAAIDATVERRAAEMNELEQLDAVDRDIGLGRLRDVRSPHPQGAAPRIGLGGAVLRRGDRELRYQPNQTAPQRFLIDRNGDERAEDAPERRLPRRAAAVAAAARVHFGEDIAPPLDQPAPGPAWGNLANFANRFFRQTGNNNNLVNALLDRGPLGLGLGLIGLGVPVAGRAPQMDDVPTILAKVVPDAIPQAPAGYTHSWDAEAIDDEVNASATIEVDHRGRVIPTTRRQAYLACACCPEPLRVSGAVRDDDDRVWALRCGHLLDQRCFNTFATGDADAVNDVPTEDEASLGGPTPKKRRVRSRKAKKTKGLNEFAWQCPVIGCAKPHVSILVDGAWKPKAGAGAVQIYV